MERDPYTMDLFPELERARARRDDPETSHEAAASIDDLTTRRRLVFELVAKYEPVTDQDIAELYAGRPALLPQSPSGLRTRRSELVEAGLVEWTGEKAKLQVSGRMARTWRLSARGRELLEEAR